MDIDLSMEHQLYGAILSPEQRSYITMQIEEATGMDKAPTMDLLYLRKESY